MQIGESIIYRLYVLVNNVITFFAIRLPDGGLDFFYSFFTGKHTGYGKKAGLHNRVDALAHAARMGYFIGIYGIKLCLLVDQVLLNNFWEFAPEFRRRIGRVQKQGSTLLEIFDQVDHHKEDPVVATDKLRLGNQIG